MGQLFNKKKPKCISCKKKFRNVSKVKKFWLFSLTCLLEVRKSKIVSTPKKEKQKDEQRFPPNPAPNDDSSYVQFPPFICSAFYLNKHFLLQICKKARLIANQTNYRCKDLMQKNDVTSNKKCCLTKIKNLRERNIFLKMEMNITYHD